MYFEIRILVPVGSDGFASMEKRMVKGMTHLKYGLLSTEFTLGVPCLSDICFTASYDHNYMTNTITAIINFKFTVGLFGSPDYNSIAKWARDELSGSAKCEFTHKTFDITYRKC